MPRLFFNIRIDGVLVIDDDGTDFPDLDAAVDEAKEAARDLIASHIRNNDPSVLMNSFEITDEQGVVLRTVPFTEGLGQEFQQAIRASSSIH
jgi:hypothetical protein